MSGLIILLLTPFLALMCLGQKCPSSEYIFCATTPGQKTGNHQSCNIPDTIKEGYMSFGVDGRYVLMPFTNNNEDGKDLNIICGNDNGNVYPGKEKYCCYIAADTSFSQQYYLGFIPRLTWIAVPELNKTEFNEGLVTIRYGTISGDRFVYRVVDNADTPCNKYYTQDEDSGNTHGGWYSHSFFPSPDSLVHPLFFFCNVAALVPPSIPSSDSDKWIICGNQGEDNFCNGLTPNSAQWVRYGDNEKYYLRLVISNDGKIPCNNRFFDNPDIGESKFCWRSEPQYTFSNIIGEWDKIHSCIGCEINEYTMSIGFENVEEYEITDTFEHSLTETISAGFDFEIASGSVELSISVGRSISNRILTSFTTTQQQELSIVCGKDILYQWTMGATQNNGLSTHDIGIKGEDFICMDNPLEPQCPPGYCSDDECQDCIQSIEDEDEDTSSSNFDEMVNYLLLAIKDTRPY